MKPVAGYVNPMSNTESAVVLYWSMLLKLARCFSKLIRFPLPLRLGSGDLLISFFNFATTSRKSLGVTWLFSQILCSWEAISFKALWHAGFRPCEQSFLCINKINSWSWQVGKSPTELLKQHDLSTFSFAFFIRVYVKLVNHPVLGVKLVIYQLADCVNSFCLCVNMTVHVFKMIHVKGPLESQLTFCPCSQC